MSLLFFAGCSYNQTKPPTPEGLKLIRARTATGTLNTKLEAKFEPNPPRAGEVSIWSLKVFDKQDKPTGERTEWKFFNPLPQSKRASEAGVSAGTTEVLMRAWIISEDDTVFLPQTPSYKAYGSFVTDWTLPKAGNYTIWVRYQPAKRGQIFPTETARWNFRVASSGAAPIQGARLQHRKKDGADIFTAYNANGKASGELVFRPETFRMNQVGGLNWAGSVQNVPQDAKVSDEELVALSPDRKIFVVFPPDSSNGVSTKFGQRGRWKLWFSWMQNGEKFIAPGFLDVK